MKKIELSSIFDLIKNNDKYGIELLYKNYYDLMFGVAFTMLKNEDISKDAVQNAVIKIWKTDKYPKSNEKTWLYSVVKNEALMILRKEKQAIPLDEITCLPSSYSKIENFHDMEHFHELIKSLNDNQKEVVTLKVLAGFSHKEIAKILNKPIGTVQWIYNTSIKKLRLALSGLILLIIASVSSLIYRLPSSFKQVIQETEDSTNLPESADDLTPLPAPELVTVFELDFLSLGLIVLSLVLILFTIIFYKKTDKLPTK